MQVVIVISLALIGLVYFNTLLVAWCMKKLAEIIKVQVVFMDKVSLRICSMNSEVLATQADPTIARAVLGHSARLPGITSDPNEIPSPLTEKGESPNGTPPGGKSGGLKISMSG